MEGMLTLKSEDQATWFRHLFRVILDRLSRFKRPSNVLRRNVSFKHTLNGMDTVDDPALIHLHLLLLLTGCEAVGDRIGSVLERRTNTVIDLAPVRLDGCFLILAESPKPLG